MAPLVGEVSGEAIEAFDHGYSVVQVMDLSTMAYLLLIAAYICVSR